jgi:hypothetical protein
MSGEAYIGTKVIQAEPMSEQEALARKLVREDVHRAQLRAGYRVRYEDGYESWTPADTFERAYRRVTDAERALLRGDDDGE